MFNFNGDEIFGTRNKDGSWDLEITGTESNSDGNSWERRITIKGANIEIEMSVSESPNIKIKAGSGRGYIASGTTHFPLA